jgi:AcrR family transcriptional regulator
LERPLCYPVVVPRPRVHDLDQLLDTAEQLVASEGASGITVRSLATAAGVSNGVIYHAFGSVGALLGQVWLRAASDFLDLQTSLVDQAGSAVEAVVAAADAPFVFAARRPAAARMLLTVKKEQLLGPQVPEELADTLFGLDKRLVSVLIRLAALVWDRRDGLAVEVITTCVVDLPIAFFRRAQAPVTADTRQRLAAAVRAVLTVAPPPTKD